MPLRRTGRCQTNGRWCSTFDTQIPREIEDKTDAQSTTCAHTSTYDKPHKYMMLSLDGMDQKKTELPHYKRLPKSLDSSALIGVHVVGVLVMNGRLQTKAYMTCGNIRNDPNLTIAVIQDVISNWVGALPDVLYLQMDNTSAQNKNSSVLAYLNMLVDRGIFVKVKVGFLLVGHTHDQIDQIFSRFSVMLGIEDAFTMPKLMAVLQKAYTPVPEMKLLTEVPDFKQYLGARGLSSRLQTLHDHSFQHQFKIWREESPVPNSGGQVQVFTVMRGKEFSTCQFWDPEEGIQLLEPAPECEIMAAPLLPLAMRSKQRTSSATAPPLSGIAGLQQYKAALQDSREHLSSEQLSWWDNFWEEQVAICNVVDAGNTLPFKQHWTWYIRERRDPLEPEPAPVEEAVVEGSRPRRLRNQRRIMYMEDSCQAGCGCGGA